MTKSAKLAQFDSLSAERDLLSLYFYDMETNRKPDASEREGIVYARLYRAMGAQAGYVVLKVADGATSPRLVTLDALRDQYASYYDAESLPIRCCIERLMIARNKLWTTDHASDTDKQCLTCWQIRTDVPIVPCNVCGEPVCAECQTSGKHSH